MKIIAFVAFLAFSLVAQNTVGSAQGLTAPEEATITEAFAGTAFNVESFTSRLGRDPKGIAQMKNILSSSYPSTAARNAAIKKTIGDIYERWFRED